VEEEVLGKAYDGRLMRRLVRYLGPYRVTVAISFFFLMILAVTQAVGPLLTKLAIDRYLTNNPNSSSPLDPWLAWDTATGLIQITGLYLATILIGLACDFGESYMMSRTGQLAMLDLRRELMEHFQKLDIAYFDQNPVGRLITRVTSDVDALNELWASGLVAVLGDFLALGFVIFAMLRLSPGLTALMLVVLPGVVYVTSRFRKTVQGGFRRIRVAVAGMNSYLQEYVSGISVVQLFNREEKSSAGFADINKQHMEAFKDTILAYGWFYPIVEFLGMLALGMLLAYGGFRIRGGALSIGVLVAFFQYGLRFFRPIQDLSEKYNILQSAMAASERVFKVLDTPANIVSPGAPKAFPGPGAAVEFDHVWFAYQGNQWVLEDVSFRIEPGEALAVVGHTGAGKTTLTNLLLRFYDVQKGAIRIGGVDIREFSLEDLRRHFAIVLQDPYLFTGTIASNIRLGAEIIDEQMEAAARQVNLLDFVRTLPRGFDESVHERGSGFSTGQKQLISFARALAHDPRFLILDEATSSVDTETEHRVRQALERLMTGRTSLAIAHRLSTIQRADRILVMHKGRLRESGRHQELLALRGIYWKLYRLQYKNQEDSLNGRLEIPGGPVQVAALDHSKGTALVD
jgi:ATP-binding cassette, subfamily B, multidrug efflux pump